LFAFSSYGSSAWIPTFFVRNHGWSEHAAGQIYGLITMVFGTHGVIAGGWITDWMARRGRRDAVMRVGMIASLVWLPSGILYPLIGSGEGAAILLVPTVFLASVPIGVGPVAIQQMVPGAMRGQASALYLFVMNLIGLGIGPTAVALVTDYVFRDDNAVNHSLLIVATSAHVAAALLLGWGLKPFRHSLDRLQEWTAGHV